MDASLPDCVEECERGKDETVVCTSGPAETEHEHARGDGGPQRSDPTSLRAEEALPHARDEKSEAALAEIGEQFEAAKREVARAR